MDSMWGDIRVNIENAPLAMLRMQASYLGESTNNVLEAVVHTQKPTTIFREPEDYDRFVHEFNIRAPLLDRYSFGLFRVLQPSSSLYPVWFEWAGKRTKINDAEAFKKQLELVLKDKRTQETVAALLSQSLSLKAQPFETPEAKTAEPDSDKARLKTKRVK